MNFNYCSYFIRDKAIFGSYPDDSKIKELESFGVHYFIDLTSDNDNVPKYKHTSTYIRYPIEDRSVPMNVVQFSKLIIVLCNIINNLNMTGKIYIHCRGGHGRSGIVVACILAHMYKLDPNEAIDMTCRYHNDRKIMKQKWRNIGSPQTYKQKQFVRSMFKPLYFYRAVKHGYLVGLSNFSLHPVNIPDFGNFPTSEAAFNAYKDPTNLIYVRTQESAKSPYISKKIGEKCTLRKDWIYVRKELALKILRYKFEQNKEIRQTLMSTGLRPILNKTESNPYWTCKGENILGVLLMKVRHEAILELPNY